MFTQPGALGHHGQAHFDAALQALERLHLKAVEVATDPKEGVDLAALGELLARQTVAACWFMPSFQNPLGALMPVARRQALVALLAQHGVPLIEDDVYGELHAGARRPPPAKTFDQQGGVLHCSSFSKCLAPGYRVGWAAAGRYAPQVERLKMMTSLATAIPPQLALADYLAQGGYDRHLRRLREALAAQRTHALKLVERHFPAGTRVTRPEGGYFLWLELPPQVDALALHQAGVDANGNPGQPLFAGVGSAATLAAAPLTTAQVAAADATSSNGNMLAIGGMRGSNDPESAWAAHMATQAQATASARAPASTAASQRSSQSSRSAGKPSQWSTLSSTSCAQAGGATAVYEYEPEPGEILSDLIPRNISVQLLRALALACVCGGLGPGPAGRRSGP